MPECLPRIGSALLVRDELNRILLGKRNKDPQRGSWIIPGGKIHAFESIAEAAARELHEETGLIVESAITSTSTKSSTLPTNIGSSSTVGEKLWAGRHKLRTTSRS